MSLKDILLQKEERVLGAWRDRLVASYPTEQAKFIAKNEDSFTNPVGMTLRPALEALYRGLASGNAPEQLQEPLDAIVRLRAVQDFTPAQALAFLPELKELVRREAGLNDEDSRHFDVRVDAALLQAFDIYSACREKLCQIRIKELHDRNARLFERQNRKKGGSV